jgi:DNA polymerase III delta prime subunit
MTTSTGDPQQFLHRSLEGDRIHSAYLLSGAGEEPREAALAFVRGLACTGAGARPCEACPGCTRSAPREEIAVDGTGKRGPLYRHVGDHPDLLWVERGAEDTRVRIGQIRAVQNALRLGASEGGRRAVVIADAEWLNQGAQNALLKLLEEPPPRTTVVLVSASPAGLLATVRSRCQKVAFRRPAPDPLADPENAELLARLGRLARATTPELLDWAEEFRGARAPAAAEVERLLDTGSAWIRARVRDAIEAPGRDAGRELGVHRELAACRKALVQRNANPQMIAERALLALQEAGAE